MDISGSDRENTNVQRETESYLEINFQVLLHGPNKFLHK